MKLITCLLLLMLIGSCTRNVNSISQIQGLWVEKTLRLDTLDFDAHQFSSNNYSSVLFNSQPFMDTSVSSSLIHLSAAYLYYYKTDSICMYNMISSAFLFRSYSFVREGTETFKVTRFYQRNALPSTIEFERIK